MQISIITLLTWLLIALIVGVIGELIAHRRTPGGFLGATLVGFLAIVLIVGVLHFSISGEPTVEGVPLLSSILVAALLTFLWSGFAYHRVAPYASRYYHRRGSYAHRPHRRRWLW
ncbi:MAG: transglycosylase [Chloroflexi bacterium]|nr:MAG: transglycosylase [Chloroflexota bacterium]